MEPEVSTTVAEGMCPSCNVPLAEHICPQFSGTVAKDPTTGKRRPASTPNCPKCGRHHNKGYLEGTDEAICIIRQAFGLTAADRLVPVDDWKDPYVWELIGDFLRTGTTISKTQFKATKVVPPKKPKLVPTTPVPAGVTLFGGATGGVGGTKGPEVLGTFKPKPAPKSDRKKVAVDKKANLAKLSEGMNLDDILNPKVEKKVQVKVKKEPAKV